MRRRSSIALSGIVPGRRSSSSSTTSRDELIKDIFHIGLVNLGNSCFYNTIVQSLSATAPLTDIIAEAPVTSPALQALSPTSPSYNPDVESLPAPIPMTAALLVLLGKLDPSTGADGPPQGKKVFNPKGLLRQLSIKYDEYAEATQQDSHELLRHLIDGIMMEEQDLIKKIEADEKKQRKRPKLQDRTETARASVSQSNGDHLNGVNGEAASVDGEGEKDGNESDEEEDSGSSSSDSSSSDSSDSELETFELDKDGNVKPNRRPFVGTIFEGKLASFIICDECKNVSLTKEDFMDLSLSLKDETGTRMRKRDRVRRALQSSFSRKNKGSDSQSSDTNSKEDLSRRTSLSENEAGGSQSEADETDEEKIRPLSGGKPRSRHNSLDPTRLSRSSLKPPEPKHSSHSTRSSRDPSPLGRALSNLSHGSNGSRHHHFSRHGKGKIPRPTPEQVAYIRKVLVDVPGPTPSLPPGLRVARPPGETPSTDSLSSLASTSSSSPPKSKFDVDWQNTDLFECFRQFTSVEVLEGENSFACRNCWKCLNPELEIKHKEEKMQRKMQRRTARALKKGQNKKMVQNGDDEEDAADETAKNSPVTRPQPIASDVPTMNLEEETSAPPPPPAALHPHHPRRNFSASTAVSSQPSLISSEGGDVSENALDTATEDEEDDDEFSTSELNGDADSLSAGPAIDAPQLPLTAENIKVVESNMGNLSVAGTAAGGTSSHPIQPPSIATATTHKAPIPSAPAPLGKAPPKAQRHILRRAHKRYLISPAELPPVLVIHLKRFMQTSKSSLFGSAFVNLKKRDDPVSFPKEMDLSPFLAPRGRPPKNPWVEELDQAHKAHWRHWGNKKKQHEDGGVSDSSSSRVDGPLMNGEPETIELEKENQDTRYRLYAVVVHFGTIDTGHYAAYVLSNRYGKGDKFAQGERKWIFTSDEDVKHVSEAEVLKSKAYMLFYERIPSTPSSSDASNRPDINSQPSQDADIPATLHEEKEPALTKTLSPEQVAADAQLAKM
ncbi:uncharacterized protein JCM6883_003973 [Sporobolomyces salmoneus]|uniref:uncharacterized protein n=1 Tax=Sporobolomyces salmoneus TaxID=183962 RepID=UPI00316BA98E